jgi:hypothetical protein
VEHQDKCVQVWLKVNTESGNCGNQDHANKPCGCKQDHCDHSKTTQSTKTACTQSKKTTVSTKTTTCSTTTASTKTKTCTKITTESAKTKVCTKTKTSEQPRKPEETKKCDDIKGCPSYLSKDFQFPHLIIPVDSSKPSKSYTTSFNGTVSSSISSIFNFDIPASFAGKRCSADFLFPEQKQLETSTFSLTGSGEVEFSDLYAPAVQGTTYENKPMTHRSWPGPKLAPGNAYRLWEGPCPAGKTIAIEMKAKDDTCFNYFQDFNPCPIGLYINLL